MKLNAKAFGLTLGIFIGGLWLLLMGLALTTGFLSQTVMTLGNLHPYFSYSWMGLVQITVMHFISGTLLGWLFAKLYNHLSK